MKKILFLLLLTVSVYGQNPSRFAKIQITSNANSGSATKVNVQESNGEVNTQTINSGFNKNVGLSSGDVVGATTLLNQYSTTPVDWSAIAFNSGQVVYYAGKQWIATSNTVASDVPATSSKWVDVTFEGLYNKPSDGVWGNITGTLSNQTDLQTALNLKANLASPSLTGTPTAPTATAGTNTTQVATTAFVTNADAGNVKTTGNQNITGVKQFVNNSTSSRIAMQTQVGASAPSLSLGAISGATVPAFDLGQTGNAVGGRVTVTSGTGIGMSFESNQTGSGGVSATMLNFDNVLTGNDITPLRIKKQGSEVVKIDYLGNITSTSFIKSTAPTTNLLLAGGGDIAQSTFQPAITGLTTNFLPKWNGSGFGNSGVVSDAQGNIVVNGGPGADTVFLNKNTGASIGFSSTNGQTNKTIIGSTNEATPAMYFYVNNAERARIAASGNSIFAGTTDNLIDRVQVNGSVGIETFMYLKPSATPATPREGTVYYDSTTKKLRCWNGTTWNDLF